jgi:hypothetical protein
MIGEAGRGDFPRFGPNKLHCLVLLTTSSSPPQQQLSAASADGTKKAPVFAPRPAHHQQLLVAAGSSSSASKDGGGVALELPMFWKDSLVQPRRLDTVLGEMLEVMGVQVVKRF